MHINWKLVAAIIFLPAALLAQSTFGTILGTVTDSTGAVVPHAKILITNQGENNSRSTLTDSQGNYETLNLKAGVYTVAAEASGFKVFKASDLELNARQTMRVDIKLELGQVSETVSVSAVAPVITTDSSAIASTFDTRQVLELPANYRGAGSTSPLRLLAYQPGIQSDNSNNFALQGGLPSQTQVSLDGISTVSAASNSPLGQLFPSAESIAEMKVQGVGNNAEFGQVGDITTTSRGGANAFHGNAYDYMQNRAFDATAFGAVSKPQKTANDFGGSLGGRIIRNRTFFFATFEDMQYRTGAALQATVPTAAMRNGDFSNEKATPVDPLNNNLPFPNKQIPTSRLNPVATKVLPFYQLPNFGSTAAQQSANFRSNASNPTTSWQYDVRIDEMLTDKQSLFGRLSWKDQNTTSPLAFVLPASTSYNNSRSVVLSHNYTLRPTMLNEFRFGLSNNDSATAYGFDGKAITGTFGLLNQPPLTFNGLPSFNFSSGTSSIGFGKAGFTFSHTYQWTDNLTWTKGRHTLKFGGDIRRLRAQTSLGFTGSDNYGNFDFDGRYSGADFSDFLLGLPYHSSYASVKQDNDGIAKHYGFFAQDSFKVTSRLTLEYGIRWEYHPPFTDTGSDITNFDRSVPLTGRVIIPSTQQALDITAPGFLQSINACPGPAFNGIPCTPVPASQAGRLPRHPALRPEEGLQPTIRICLSSLQRHQDRNPRRRGPLHHDHSRSGLLFTHRHQQLRRSRVHQLHTEWQAALPVAADFHQRQRRHLRGLRQRILRHRQRPEFQGPLLLSVERERRARPRLEHRLARLLHRLAHRAVALGAGTESAATLHHAVRAAPAHRSPVPVLGPHQYARHRSQRDLQLDADRAHAPHAQWPVTE